MIRVVTADGTADDTDMGDGLGGSSSSGAAGPTVIGEPIDNRAGMITEMRNMFAEMSRQNQDAIFHGFQRGAQHVGEQMNLEQHRRAMVQEIGAGMQPFLTQNQQLIRAQNEMMRGMDAHAAGMRADLAGISREHVAAAGRMDTSLAAFTDLIQNAGAQIAQTGANTNTLTGALAQHSSQ